MPKRRMTPARRAQIKQWQGAGVKARKNKGFPDLTLYHVTTSTNASRILKEGFKGTGIQLDTRINKPIWFSNRPIRTVEDIGKRSRQSSTLKVRVPQSWYGTSKLRADTFQPFNPRVTSVAAFKRSLSTQRRRANKETWYIASANALKGLRVKKIKRRRVRR